MFTSDQETSLGHRLDTFYELTFAIVLSAAVLLQTQPAVAQSSSFTYQGQLRLSGEPFTGIASLEFRLFDQLSGGFEIGIAELRSAWPVEDGLFQVELDFGSMAFDGSDRFLEISVDGAPLIPRQKVTATPYALLATGLTTGSVGGGAIDPTEVQLRVSGTCPAGQSIRIIDTDGSVTCQPDEVGIPGWSLSGNAGTDPGIQFLGTTDAAPFELRTNSVRGLRIEPSAELFQQLPITANIIAGSRANGVAAGVRGATIAGGGAPQGDSDPAFTGDEIPNRVADHYGTVGGGFGNLAGSDDGDLFNGTHSTIGGGRTNSATGTESTVGGGRTNSATGSASTVGGGLVNSAQGSFGTVGGGISNSASGPSSTVAGGETNAATGNESTVGGGSFNTADGETSTVAGGTMNASTSIGSTVAGGQFNTASATFSTVAGGGANTASGSGSAVGGGLGNCAGGTHSWAGGRNAKIRPGTDSGDPGSACTGVAVSGDGDGDEGTFVWADNQAQSFVSAGPNQFLVRAEGGIGFGRTPSDHFEIDTPFEQVAGNGSGTEGAFRVRINGASRLRVLGNGGVAVGGSFTGSGVPENGLRVAGLARVDGLGAAGSTALCRNASNEIASCSSSRRYKDHIEELELGLATVLALRPVGYRWLADGSEDIGFVAEEMATVDERLITRNEAGAIEGVRYDRITAILTNAVREIFDQDLRDRTALQDLESENSALRARLAEVEARYSRELETIRGQLQRDLATLRREFAALRDLMAPQVALEHR